MFPWPAIPRFGPGSQSQAKCRDPRPAVGWPSKLPWTSVLLNSEVVPGGCLKQIGLDWVRLHVALRHYGSHQFSVDLQLSCRLMVNPQDPERFLQPRQRSKSRRCGKADVKKVIDEETEKTWRVHYSFWILVVFTPHFDPWVITHVQRCTKHVFFFLWAGVPNSDP